MRIKQTVVVSSSGNAPPLIEPDRRFSRIRLSEAVHRTRCRGHPLRGATQCPLRRTNLSCRCYLPEGSHRTVLRFAVHVDQVRSLRSSPVTGLHRYYEPLRLLPRPNGPHGFAACARCWASPPTERDLIPCPHHPSEHSTLADPAAVMSGQCVVQASPVRHGVCFGPALAAFAVCGAARLAVFRAHEAHSMRLTFVADCSFSVRLLSTCPHGHAVAAPSRRNDLIGRMRLSLMVGWFSGSHPLMAQMGLARQSRNCMRCCTRERTCAARTRDQRPRTRDQERPRPATPLPPPPGAGNPPAARRVPRWAPLPSVAASPVLAPPAMSGDVLARPRPQW